MTETIAHHFFMNFDSSSQNYLNFTTILNGLLGNFKAVFWLCPALCWGVVSVSNPRLSLPCIYFGQPLYQPTWATLRAPHTNMRQKRQKLTSASWLRPVCSGFYNLVRFNCAPFFASCRRHLVLTVTCRDACRCAVYVSFSICGISSLDRTGYGLDDRGVGVRVPVRSRIFFSPRRPDRLWGPPNLLTNGYRGLFPRR
jgi:hypothetical protein